MRRGKRRGNGRLSISIIVIALLVVMSVQVIRLRSRAEALAIKEEALKEALAKETERAEEIEGLADYMKTKEYIEDIAKSKLGLAYENEIIFKERKE